MSYPRVSIIILNWNGWKDTIECLESLYQISYANYDVIVVDNASEDDSIKKIKEYTDAKPIKALEIDEEEAREGKFSRMLYDRFQLPGRMILIKNKENYGFAGGNNIGIRFALNILNPDYVLLLNSDTVVDPEFLGQLVRAAEGNEKIASVQSLLLRPDGETIDSLGQQVLRGASKDIGIDSKYSKPLQGNVEIFGARSPTVSRTGKSMRHPFETEFPL